MLRSQQPHHHEIVDPQQRPDVSPASALSIAQEFPCLGPLRKSKRSLPSVATRPFTRRIFDPPRSLEELQLRAAEELKRRVAGEPATPGYQIHHIVEQTPAENDKFPRSLIDAPENLVLAPELRHRQITGWFARKNKNFADRPPRDALRGQDWAERQRVGLEALRIYGVLKP